jgi:hypothetical protein
MLTNVNLLERITTLYDHRLENEQNVKFKMLLMKINVNCKKNEGIANASLVVQLHAKDIQVSLVIRGR